MTPKEYKKNVELLKKWAEAYYKEDNPLVSDEVCMINFIAKLKSLKKSILSL